MIDGLQAHYTLRELAQALWFAGMAQLAAATELAGMAGDESLAVKVLEHFQAYVASTDRLAIVKEIDT